MNHIKSFVVLFLAAFSLVSCGEDPDRVGPEIEIVNIAEGQSFKFGETLTMYFKFTDQTGIYEYKYEIVAKDYTNQSFYYENHRKLVGYYTSFEEPRSVLLPEKSSTSPHQEGEYIIKVTAADVQQNMSTFYRTINIHYPEETED